MKRIGKSVVYGLITVAIALRINLTHIYPLTATSTSPQTQTTIPRRLTITVNISEPDDLKVSEEERIAKGQIIANRERERTRLQAQEKQLQLSLGRLKAVSITPPAAPQAVPTAMALPPISYLEQEAAVEKTKSAIGPSAGTAWTGYA